MSNSIGAIAFDNLLGDVDFPQMRRDVENRSGDDGVSVFNTGRRGNAFVLTGKYAFATYALARTAEQNWANTFTAAPVNIVLGGVTFAGSGVQFIVLEVQTKIVPMVFYHCPRANVSPAYVVEGTFKIQPVEV
jgi:NAD/NADP transhydrogenase beta subunit